MGDAKYLLGDMVKTVKTDVVKCKENFEVALDSGFIIINPWT